MSDRRNNKCNVLPQVRCAIYTRKSTEENLDTDFNSLDAQREAAEAYIASQRQEGWVALPTRYDDGGFSGGTLERPALQHLLRDIEAGRIDCIVVYKVDRLSRSLLDFTKIVESFDRGGVSFVSVTQHFNTTDSMGRLTLNILLSFAQFERELIGERIRDKIAATRRKGKYIGGPPVLGYGVDRANHRLVVEESEAKLVRKIFRRFLESGSTTALAKELNDQGYLTKTWVTKQEKVREGKPWNKSHLYRLLNNPLYIGEVAHKGNRYPGEHAAIISRELWEKVHAILQENCRIRGNHTRAKTTALLRGLIRCMACGCAMYPTFTKRRGKVYRYYLCAKAVKHGYDSCPVRTLPAGDIEQAVVAQLRRLFCAPEMVAATLTAAQEERRELQAHLQRECTTAEESLNLLKAEVQQLLKIQRAEPAAAFVPSRLADREAQIFVQERLLLQTTQQQEALSDPPIREAEVIASLTALDPVWEELFPAEQARIIQLLVARVEISVGGLEVKLRADGLKSLAAECHHEGEQ